MSLKKIIDLDLNLGKSSAEIEALINKYKGLKAQLDLIKTANQALRDEQVQLNRLFAENKGTEQGKQYAAQLKEVQQKLKEGANEARKAQDAMRQLNEEFKNAKPAENTYAAISRKLKELELQRKDTTIGTPEFDRLTKEAAEATAKLKELDAQTGRFQRNVGDYEQSIIRAFQRLGLNDAAAAGIDQLRKKTTEAAAEAKRLGDRLSELRKTNTDTASQEINELEREFVEANQRAQQLERSLDEINRSTLGNIKSELREAFSPEGLLKQGAAFAVSSLSLTALISGVQQYGRFLVDVSKAQREVAKTAGLSNDAVDELTESLKKIDTPTGLLSLLDIARVAGQLGVAQKDIAGFTESVDKAFVALGDELGTAEQVATTLGRISNIFGLDLQKGVAGGIDAVGSALNQLSNDSSATADFMADVTLRVAGIAKTSKIAAGDILGLASVLQQNGVSAEVAGTALNKIIGNLAKDYALIAKTLNLTTAEQKKFADLINTDTNAALTFFLQNLNVTNTSALDLGKLLKQLGVDGEREANALKVLATSLDDIAISQDTANKQIAEATSINKEAEAAADTLAGSVGKLFKSLQDLGQQSGIRDFLKSIVDGITLVIDAISYGINELFFLTKLILRPTQAISTLLDRINGKTNDITPQDRIDIEKSILSETVQDNTSNIDTEKSAANALADIAKAQEEAAEKTEKASKRRADALEKETKDKADKARKAAEIERTLQNELLDAERDFLRSKLDIENSYVDKSTAINLDLQDKLNSNQANYDKQLAELKKSLDEKVLTQQQYNDLLSDIEQTRQKRDLVAQAEYNKQQIALEKERADQLLQARTNLANQLANAEKIGIEGATTNTDSFERQRSAIRAQLNADKLAIEAKIKELELKSQTLPNDEAITNDLKAAKQELQNTIDEAENSIKGINADVLNLGLEEAIKTIDRSFAEKQKQIRLSESEQISQAETPEAKQQISDFAADAELINERTTLQAKAALYQNYLDTIVNSTDISAEQRREISEQLQESLLGIEAELTDNYIALQEQKLQATEQTAEKRREIEQAFLSISTDALNGLKELYLQDIDNNLADAQERINIAKEDELKLYGVTAEQKAAIEKKYQAQSDKLNQEANNRKKSVAIADAFIKGQLAVLDILAKNAGNPILAGILIAGAELQTALSIAAISSQKYKFGGEVKGASHEMGGVQIEAEGGEGMVNSMANRQYRNLVSLINQAAGGGIRFDNTPTLTPQKRNMLDMVNDAIKTPNSPQLPSWGAVPMFIEMKQIIMADLTDTNKILKNIERNTTPQNNNTDNRRVDAPSFANRTW